MNRIRTLRWKAGLTQKELAERMGLKQTAVSWWETDRGNPSASTLPKLAAVLNCTVDDLIRND